jgi:hypothetical protein
LNNFRGIILSAVILAAAAAGAESTHEVRTGDTLWDISRHYYGDSFKWPMIWKDNVFINDPDLIYPKEKLHIPGFPDGGESIRLNNPELFKIEAARDAGTAEASGSAAEQIEKADSINSFRSEKLNSFDSVLDEEPEFSVISTEQGREMVSTGGFITVDAGTEKGLSTGDTLIIYEKRYRLDRGNYVYSCVGYAEIVKAGDSSSKARVYKAFSSVSKGFRASKSGEISVSMPKAYRSVDSDISGEIVYLSENHRFSAEGYTVIVNLGKSLPLKQGDKFEVIRKTEENGVIKTDSIGEGQLLLVNRDYSTMYLVNSSMEIMKGDRIRLNKIAVY